ncbi:MAG: glycosyltransferase family 2 protein [Oscillospiraceae bacterium]|nr:glycosyltransferase family 2 protein [Oscillospiraceae bacterium]
MPFITIFTPTYNRAYTLPALYDSLRKQTDMDFEWLVVDDGSTDNTEDLFRQWVTEEKNFDITYFKTPNGGKQRAINEGVKNASGRYFWIVDSDDMLVPQSVEICAKWLRTIDNEPDIIGVSGTIITKDGQLLGETFEREYVDATSLERDKYNIKGDKSEIFRTDVLKQFPFPSFAGEKFVPEALVWNRIAMAGYKLRWFNEAVYIAEYLPDGYSRNVDKNLISNWKGYSLYVKEVVASSMPLRNKILIFGAYCLRFIKKICRKY